jgi:hypothetical protein
MAFSWACGPRTGPRSWLLVHGCRPWGTTLTPTTRPGTVAGSAGKGTKSAVLASCLAPETRCLDSSSGDCMGAHTAYICLMNTSNFRQRNGWSQVQTGRTAPPNALNLNGAGAATVHIGGGEPNQIQSPRGQKFQEAHIHQPAPKNTSEYPISPLERERIQTRPPRQPLPIHPHSWTDPSPPPHALQPRTCQYPFGVRSWLFPCSLIWNAACRREARTAKQTIAPAKPTPNPSSSRRSSSSNFFCSPLSPLDYVPRSSSRVANNNSIPQSWVRTLVSLPSSELALADVFLVQLPRRRRSRSSL